MAKRSPSKPSPPPKPAQKPVPSATSAGAATSWDDVVDQRRVKDVASARQIYNKFVIDNTQRAQTFAMTRNQLEGGRPFNPADLKAQGASWQTNVNFGDAQAARDRTLLPYWKMVNDVPHKAAFTIRVDSPQVDVWQVKMAEAYDDYLVDRGASYQIEFMNFCSNFVNFGPGIVQWRDKNDPRWEAVNVTRVYFPKNGRMNPEAWDCLCLVADMSPSDLYIKVKDKESKRRSSYLGWNVKAVQQAIAQFKDGTTWPNPYDATRWQDMFVNNDIYVTSQFQPLQLVWMFIRNFDGSVAARVFTQQGGVEDFLFEDDKYAESFRHILGAVWYDTGTDSMVHSIKGFGIKNFYFSALVNRTKSRFIDAGTFSFGLNFQRDQDMPDEAPPVENYGPMSVFPAGLKQITVYPQIQQGAAIIGMLEGNRDKNNALYRDQQQTDIAETDTAKQAEILAAMQADTTQSSASIFLAQYGENVISEEVRRLRTKGNQNPDAKKWVERLRAAGVPDNVIFITEGVEVVVTTGANAGMASPAMRTQAFKEGLALSQMPGVNRDWFLRNFIANRYGSAAVKPGNALMAPGSASMPAQRREAKMENTSFGQGVPLEVAPEDAHFEHIQEHLTPMEAIAQQFRGSQQLTPEQGTALVIGLEHTAEHMQYLSQDQTQKQQFQQVNGLFRDIQSVARGYLTSIARQQQGQAQQAGMSQPAAT